MIILTICLIQSSSTTEQAEWFIWDSIFHETVCICFWFHRKNFVKSLKL